MITTGGRVVDVMLWCLLAWFAAHLQLSETRMEEVDSKYKSMETHTQSTENPKPEPPRTEMRLGKCFHMSREECPAEVKCRRVEPDSVFCCDVDSFRLKEALAITMTQNTTNLHVLNASIPELDVSQSIFRRLTSMALTDGNIGKITGQFPKYSSIACLNISNNNLSSATLQPPIQRPFAYLFNLTLLDASTNNLTEFPLSLVQSNRKISVDLSGNNYLPCKHFSKVMETNNSSLVTFLNYDKTFCALDLRFNWFKDVLIVPIDHVRVQKELNISCRDIRPAGSNCTCMPDRLELVDGVNNVLAVLVDCSQRSLREMPTNLPPNTAKLNVSYNNITSLQPVSDPSYEHVRQLMVDHNDIANIVELEGTKFIDHFMVFSITHNKLKTIHTYILSDRFETTGPSLFISDNYIHCDCNTEKVLKPWLLEHFKNIPDYKGLKCEENNIDAVVDLRESQVCHTPRDWTDYIYYIIGLEVLILVLLISKVSYDYWVFKTAGYLPWPANKMPRLPCDWLCE